MQCYAFKKPQRLTDLIKMDSHSWNQELGLSLTRVEFDLTALPSSCKHLQKPSCIALSDALIKATLLYCSSLFSERRSLLLQPVGVLMPPFKSSCFGAARALELVKLSPLSLPSSLLSPHAASVVVGFSSIALL